MNSGLFKRNLARRGQIITLQNRDIVSPVFGSIDFDEDFTADQEVNALIKTIKGKTFFDGVSTERLITHEMCIEYIGGVTADTWVLFKGRRIDVLAVENKCEQDAVLVLICSDRGTGEAAKA